MDILDIEAELLNLPDADVDDAATTATSGDKTPVSWRQVEITQDWSYGWTPDAVAKFLDGWPSVSKYAYIGHDKDFKVDCTTPRDSHTHLLVKFDYPVATSAILARAKAVGLPDDCITSNRLQKIKKWQAALNYLTHRDEHLPYKHVYDVSEVHSNFDWQAECESYHSEKDLKTTNVREKEIVDGIFNGTIKEYNLAEHMTSYEMVKYDLAISKSLKHIAQLKMKEERDMQVIFISGPSGVGKDTFAVEWCKERNFEYYRTNNNPDNPFDNYRGEPVIIWSDARDDVFKPHNLHQLLDNHYSSMQKSRYHDRYIAARYMIITSISPLEDWYSHFYARAKEDKTQLYRRIATNIVMSQSKISVYAYNFSVKEYEYVCSMPNNYTHDDDSLSTHEKQVDFVKDLLGGFSNFADFSPDSNPSLDVPSNPFISPVISTGK